MSAKLEGKTAQERECQDQMLRVAQGFTNLGMQLKILCSVKAASVETNKVIQTSKLALNILHR